MRLEKPKELDVAVSPDGRHVFVLTLGGAIFVYAQDGQLEDKIQEGNHAVQLKIGPRGEQLFITSRKDMTVQIIRLDFIESYKTPSYGRCQSDLAMPKKCF